MPEDHWFSNCGLGGFANLHRVRNAREGEGVDTPIVAVARNPRATNLRREITRLHAGWST
jgi:hypothetical protein